MKKKVLAVVLSLIMIAGMIPAAFGAEIAASGACGPNLTWTLDSEGTLTISGKGKMNNYSQNSTEPWYSKAHLIKKVVIEDGVTSIGDYAFYKCSVGLTSIEIPDTVTSIGTYAFNHCDKLKDIEIPDSVISIGSCAFSYCGSIESIKIPDGVTSIEDRMFWACGKIKNIEIPNSVTSIGAYAFDSCSSLEALEIPENVTSIEKYAFYFCSSLTSVEIPANVTSIGEAAFNGCSSLVDIFIPNGVTEIGDRAFINCTSLTGVEIPYSVTTMGYGVFNGCSSLERIVIPDSLTSISRSTFNNCGSLLCVEIPATLTQIGDYAFYNCNLLTDVYYTGNPSEWNTISIGTNNDPLINANISYNSSMPPAVNYTWDFSKDSYSFKNSANDNTSAPPDVLGFGSGPYYVSDMDLGFFKRMLPETDIDEIAENYGKEPDSLLSFLFLRDTKKENFLNNKMKDFTGSCYGLSLTMALFKTGIMNPADYGATAGTTRSIPAIKSSDNTDLESMINIYNFSQMTHIAKKVEKEAGENGFSQMIDTMYNNALKIGRSGYQPYIISLRNPGGHAVLCFGAEAIAPISYNGKSYNRKLLIADPNDITKECHIYISDDNTTALYHDNINGICNYKKFGYFTSSLEDLNTYSYDDITAYKNIVAEYKAKLYADSELMVEIIGIGSAIISGSILTVAEDGINIEQDSIVNETADGENYSFTRYLLYDDADEYIITPHNDENAVSAKLYYDDFALGVDGIMESAHFSKNGMIEVTGAVGDVAVSITENDNVFDFVTVDGNADGDFSVAIDGENIEIKGAISDFKVTNMTINAEKDNIVVNGDYNAVISMNKGDVVAMIDKDNNGTYETKVEEVYTVGDLNADGKVTAKDKAILNRYLAGWEGYKEQILSWEAADIDGDGKVTAKDKAILNRYLAGWEGYDKYFE